MCINFWVFFLERTNEFKIVHDTLLFMDYKTCGLIQTKQKIGSDLAFRTILIDFFNKQFWQISCMWGDSFWLLEKNCEFDFEKSWVPFCYQMWMIQILMYVQIHLMWIYWNICTLNRFLTCWPEFYWTRIPRGGKIKLILCLCQCDNYNVSCYIYSPHVDEHCWYMLLWMEYISRDKLKHCCNYTKQNFTIPTSSS